MSKKHIPTILLIGFVILVGAIVWIACIMIPTMRQIQLDSEALVDGTLTASVKEIRIYGQQIHVRCRSKEVVDYFTERLNRPRIDVGGGIIYRIDITMTDGKKCELWLNITGERGERKISIHYDEEGIPTKGIDMSSPRPRAIDDLLEVLYTASPSRSEF